MSYYQWVFKVHVLINAVAFHAFFPVAVEFVNAEAICLFVYHVQQLGDEPVFLHFVDGALEYGKLYALTEGFAYLRDAAESAFAFRGFGIHVVCYDYIHGSLGDKWDVIWYVAAQVTGEDARL